MDRQKYLLSKRKELVKTATAMIKGDLDLVVGCRLLCKLRNEVEPVYEELFILIRAVESETDHIPAGKVRINCSNEYLEKVDDETKQYLEDVKEEIIYSCKKLIQVSL